MLGLLMDFLLDGLIAKGEDLGGFGFEVFMRTIDEPDDLLDQLFMILLHLNRHSLPELFDSFLIHMGIVLHF